MAALKLSPLTSWLQRALLPSSAERTALVLLNTPQDPSLVETLWDQASLHVCCDGASNRLKAICTLIPEVIVGDLDSALPSVLNHYRQAGSKIMDQSADQDSTDLDKALKVAAQRGCDSAVVLGRFSGSAGRLDHTFGVVQSMFLALNPAGLFRNVLVMSEESTMQLLLPAHNPHCVEAIPGSTCGLIPIAGACADVTTSGLEWDLEHGALGFGGLVSTSNQAVRAQVTVVTDCPLLWTMAFPGSESEGDME